MVIKKYVSIKGCALFAAFFMISACQESSNPSNRMAADEQKVVLTEVRVDPSHKQEAIKNIEKNTQESIASTDPTTNIFLTTNPQLDPPATTFSCDDQIYLTIKTENHPLKFHKIHVSWKDPQGEERENNTLTFFASQKESVHWAALKLHRSVGAGLLQWVNPAAGMEEFIGHWTVDVKVGSLLKKTINFELLC